MSSAARRTRLPFAIANAARTGIIKRGDLFAKSPFRGLATDFPSKHVWSKEWDKISLGATPPWEHKETNMNTVLFVETGFGCVFYPRVIFPANSVLCCRRGHVYADRFFDVVGATSMEIVKAVEVPKPLCELAGSVLYALNVDTLSFPPSLCHIL
jgi:hypothetical protein